MTTGQELSSYHGERYWSSRIADDLIQYRLWHAGTPENRETLIIVMESGNKS